MKIFDTHCYTGLISTKKVDRVLALSYAKIAGVEKILNITNSLGDFEEVYNDLKLQKNLYFALGISPVEINNPSLSWKEKLENYSKLGSVIAIGETGLDYQKGCADKDLQKEFFLYHIKLAEKTNKPLIVHNRNAGEDIVRILSDNAKNNTIIFHCYTDKISNTEKALELNSYFSFSGNVTYQKSKDTVNCVKFIPLDRILVESGTPFMTPFAQKGERNKIQNITENIKAISRIKGETFENTANIIWENSLRAFGISE